MKIVHKKMCFLDKILSLFQKQALIYIYKQYSRNLDISVLKNIRKLQRLCIVKKNFLAVS
jgi:hypothetical protein